MTPESSKSGRADKKLRVGLLLLQSTIIVLTAGVLLNTPPPYSRFSYNALLCIIICGLVLLIAETLALFIDNRVLRRSSRFVTSLWVLVALPCTGLQFLGLKGMPSPVAIAGVVLVTLIVPLIFLRAAVREKLIKRTTLKWPSRVLLFTFTTVACFTVLELVAGPFIPDFSYKVKPDPDCAFEMVNYGPDKEISLSPGFRGVTQHHEFFGIPVSINSDGYRDRPWNTDAAKPGVSRILALGDSLTFGTGVRENETYLRRMEELPEAEGRILTFNAGVPGHGPVNYYFTLTKLAKKLRPDIVIMGVYTGNDLSDTVRVLRNQTIDSMRRQEDGVEAETEIKTKPKEARAPLTQILRHLDNYNYWTMESKICSLLFPPIVRVLVSMHLSSPHLVCNTFLVESCSLDPEPKVQQAFVFSEAAIRHAYQFCKDHSMHFMVVLIPPVMMLDNDMLDRITDRYPQFKDKKLSRDIVHRKLCAYFEEQGIPYLDLLPLFRKTTAEGETLYHNEGHWNAAGHALAAETIYHYIQSRNWLTSDCR